MQHCKNEDLSIGKNIVLLGKKKKECGPKKTPAQLLIS